MSEFADFPTEARPLGEVLADLRDQARDFIGEIATQAGIVYQEERPRQTTQPDTPTPEPKPTPPHVCGASCSRCGIGGQQWRPRG